MTSLSKSAAIAQTNKHVSIDRLHERFIVTSPVDPLLPRGPANTQYFDSRTKAATAGALEKAIVAVALMGHHTPSTRYQLQSHVDYYGSTGGVAALVDVALTN